MPPRTPNMPRILMELTPDEAAALHHAFVNGLQTGSREVRQSLSVKIERCHAQAQTVRALEATRKLHNGKEAAYS